MKELEKKGGRLTCQKVVIAENNETRLGLINLT